jgi:Poly(ADP-ribose) polymerase catalytic domain
MLWGIWFVIIRTTKA